MLHEEVRRHHHAGASVHHDADTSLRQLGTEGIRALRNAGAGKQRRRPLADKRLKVAGIQHHRHIRPTDLLADEVDGPGIRHIAEVEHPHVRAALPPQVQCFHRQIGGFEPAAYQRCIGIVGFGKALPGAAHILFCRRLADAAGFKALIAQRQRPGYAVHHHHGKPAHCLGKQVAVGFHLTLLTAQQALVFEIMPQLFRRPGAGLHAVQRTQQKIADGGIGNEAVKHKGEHTDPVDLEFIENEVGGTPHPCFDAFPQQSDAGIQLIRFFHCFSPLLSLTLLPSLLPPPVGICKEKR